MQALEGLPRDEERHIYQIQKPAERGDQVERRDNGAGQDLERRVGPHEDRLALALPLRRQGIARPASSSLAVMTVVKYAPA